MILIFVVFLNNSDIDGTFIGVVFFSFWYFSFENQFLFSSFFVSKKIIGDNYRYLLKATNHIFFNSKEVWWPSG